MPEGIGCGVHADEALAAADGVVEGLFTVGREGRCAVGARHVQVARRVKGEGVPLADLVGFEERSVLGGDDLEAMFLAGLDQGPLGESQVSLPVPRLWANVQSPSSW